eukprot:GFUD01068719.1.p1 GENE.GFUD01068719.1~~GFUD01068719.1.p1  ORF type:complete len:487 (+),score=104.25 GFUD01068719.1:100-1560(+)
MYELVLVAVVLCILFKILNVNNSPEKSIFYCSNQNFLDEFLKRAPELTQPYVPTRFWGFSGHIQTIVQSVISRLHCPLVNGHRISMKLTDGATVTYDLYHAINQQKEMLDITLAICPGIGNNSESVYIRRVVYHAQLNGYRVCVLNHIGTLASVPVTSPRIFMYGNTADYAAMIKDVVRRYPGTKLVCVGFSMGGNIVGKYLGEPRIKPVNVVAGVAVCAGYDMIGGMRMLMEWNGFRRMYMYAMTENMKAIIRRCWRELFTEQVKNKLGISERQVFNSGTLVELDDVYTRRLAGFKSVTEFYIANSSYHHFKNIKVPTVFINARDDPIIPPPLLEVIRDAALKYENIVFVEQKFGGHLGFYEGGFLRSNPLTWQDRMVVHIADALVEGGGKEKEGLELESENVSNATVHTSGVFDDTGTESDEKEGEFVHRNSGGPNLRIEKFNIGMTSDYTSLDSSDPGSPTNLTPANTPVLRRKVLGCGGVEE